MNPPIRALILADDCNPDWPSLPVVGFKAARAIAEHADVTVATHVRNRESIERVGMGRAKIAYVDNEYIARGLYRLNTWLRGGDEVGWTTSIAMSYPSYLAFEWEVWRRFGAALREGKFDVVHRLTPMSPTLPSPIARECPVPFVLGPLNGGLPWPAGYGAERDREREWLVKLREAYRYLPFHGSSYAGSSAILAAFRHTCEDLPESVRDRVIHFPEVGIDPDLFRASAPRKSNKSTFLFAGRLVPYKLPGLPIDCFARSAELREHRLLIVGDGPEREVLERQIRRYDLEGCVQLLGRRPQAEVGELMRQSDVFVFPSIRELGAGVVAEAMASGLCCVATDYGGPAELLAAGRGVKVPMAPREQLTTSFTRTLEEVARSPERTRRVAEQGRRYALDHLTWDVKARYTVEIYRWVMGQRESRPTPFGDDARPTRRPGTSRTGRAAQNVGSAELMHQTGREVEALDSMDDEPRVGDGGLRLPRQMTTTAKPRPERVEDLLRDSERPASGTDVLVKAQLPSRSNDPEQLRQRAALIGHRAQDERSDGNVEGCVREGQVIGEPWKHADGH